MNVAALAGLAEAIERGDRLPAVDAAELAAAIRDALAGRQSLDAALGLRGGPGERSAATRLMLARRDALLREAADRHFPDQPAAQQAEALAEAWRRYEASAWPRERGATVCPPRHAGAVHALLWQAMKAGAMPVTARRIREILATSSAYSSPPEDPILSQ